MRPPTNHFMPGRAAVPSSLLADPDIQPVFPEAAATLKQEGENP
jgi:hypothetical protein